MRGWSWRWLAVLLACAPAGHYAARAQSLPPEWEVRDNMAALADQVRKLKPMLQEVKPAEWVQKGAPEAYQEQLKSVQAEIDYLIQATAGLSREPERLTLALETLLRLQSLDSMLVSITEGVRRYQNPALAELLTGAVNSTAVHRDKLRQYVVELAAAKEQECKVMNEEAQRCRGMLSRQPPAKPGAAKTESK